MKTFEKSILKHLLELYDAHLSSGYEPPKKKLEEIEKIRIALYRPKKFRCHFKSHDICLCGFVPHHLKKCIGINNCIEAISKKKKEQSIVFK